MHPTLIIIKEAPGFWLGEGVDGGAFAAAEAGVGGGLPGREEVGAAVACRTALPVRGRGRPSAQASLWSAPRTGETPSPFRYSLLLTRLMLDSSGLRFGVGVSHCAERGSSSCAVRLASRLRVPAQQTAGLSAALLCLLSRPLPGVTDNPASFCPPEPFYPLLSGISSRFSRWFCVQNSPRLQLPLPTPAQTTGACCQHLCARLPPVPLTLQA